MLILIIEAQKCRHNEIPVKYNCSEMYATSKLRMNIKIVVRSVTMC